MTNFNFLNVSEITKTFCVIVAVRSTVCVAVIVFLMLACVGCGCKEQTANKLTQGQIKEKSFDDLFKQIAPKDIPGDVFTLVNKDLTVLTGGTPEHYNSMIASWGGWGTLFEKPVTWCFLRANRYTLEFIKKDLKYTMSYFDNEYKQEILSFGKQSGRTTDKMKNTSLTAVQTPAGNMTFKEAKIIIECELFEMTTVSPDDFKDDEARKFIIEANEEAKDYHKIVFGVITNVWIRKTE
jgi:flavin reductase (DIM6/NTAB) family NADH-FMN oxidoreductase RutF